MEFTEIQELDNMVHVSQTYNQAGLTEMNQQLQNTPKNNQKIVMNNFSELSQVRNTNLNAQISLNMQSNIPQKTASANINQKTQQILQKYSKDEKQEEDLDEIINEIGKIVETANQTQVQQELDIVQQENMELSNSIQQKNKDNTENQKGKISKQNTSKKQENKEIEKEITNIIKTYQQQVFQDDEEDEDSDDNDDDDDDYDSSQEFKQQKENEKGENKSQEEKVQKKQEEEINLEDKEVVQPSQFEKLDVNAKPNFPKKSLFTENLNKGISQSTQEGQQKAIFEAKKKNPNMRSLEVFFFNSPEFKIHVSVLKTIKVLELIQIIMEEFLKDSKCDSSRLKYPNYPQAYELRILEDDNNYVPDMSFPALDPTRNIRDIEFNQIAFVENAKFVVPKEAKQSQIDPKFQQIIANKNKNNIILKVEVPEHNDCWTTVISVPIDQKIVDIFVPLQKKNPKLTQKSYLVIVKNKNGSQEEVDPQIPIQCLTANLDVIILQKRKFADMPSEVEQGGQSFVRNLIEEQLNTYQQQNMQIEHQNPQAPLNLIQASKYEEFDVIKINDRGRRQERILGINQFKIFNINSKLSGQNLGLLDQLFNNSITGTKKAERLIEDIISIELLSKQVFQMKVKNDVTSGFKNIVYETKNEQTAKKIIDKIQFLIKITQQQ